MKILSCDQSFTHSAVVITENNSILEFNVFSSNKEASIFDRALDIANRLSESFLKHNPDEFILEGLAFGMRGNATRDLSGLQFVIICLIKQIHNFHNFKIISPKTLKKIATGSGKATKKEIIAALPEDIKKLFMDRNYKLTTGLADLADAYFLSKC